MCIRQNWYALAYQESALSPWSVFPGCAGTKQSLSTGFHEKQDWKRQTPHFKPKELEICRARATLIPNNKLAKNSEHSTKSDVLRYSIAQVFWMHIKQQKYLILVSTKSLMTLQKWEKVSRTRPKLLIQEAARLEYPCQGCYIQLYSILRNRVNATCTVYW